MIIKCDKCVVSFEIGLDSSKHNCPNCGVELTHSKPEHALGHDGKVDFTPKFIRGMVLRPLN
jgi:rRNA maturation endonuclease Nob1